MRQIFKLSIILMLFAGIASFVLATVYKYTSPHIEAQRLKQEQEALAFVFPQAAEFKKVSEGDQKYYQALDKDKILLGFVLGVTAKGYGGDIVMLAGLEVGTKTITGIKILEHQETPGLGANITKEDFTRQFNQKQMIDLNVVKQENGKNILAITGATISTDAVVDAVRNEMEAFLKTKGI